MVGITSASIVLGYACLAYADVTIALRASPLKQPMWARRPSTSAVSLHALTWPVGHVFRAFYVHPRVRLLSVGRALLAIVVSWFLVSGLIWLGFEGAALGSTSSVVR